MSSTKLKSEAPMNNPNKPPEFDRNCDVLRNSKRFIGINSACLNETIIRLNDALKCKEHFN